MRSSGGALLVAVAATLLPNSAEAFFNLRNFAFLAGRNSSTPVNSFWWPNTATNTASNAAAQCKTVTPPTDIDLTTYASKPWFIHQQMISDSGNPGNKWNSCVRAVYTIKDARNVGVYNRAVEGGVNGTLHEANLCAVLSDRKKPGELKVGPCIIPTAFYGPYWIVFYDEKEGYAMVSGGQPYIPKADGLCATGNGVNKSGLWLFSRSPVRDEALIKKVRAMAVAKGAWRGVAGVTMPTIQYPAPPTGAERDALIARMASVIQMEPPTKPQPWFHRPYIPMLRRKHYSFADLRGDVLSGVIAAVVAIPQGLAYALLASLPPVVGLYTSSLPPMIYAGLGTSNVCSIGPNALVAMFLPQLVYHWEFASDPSAVAARSSLAAIIVGVVNLLIGMVRLGGLVRFISGPVLTGFTNAAAMVIFISQLPIILGFAMPQFPYVYQQLTFLLGAMFKQTRPISLAVGLATVLFLYLCRFLSKRFHYSAFCQALGTGSCLIAAVLATVASRTLILSGHDIQILGHVPSGMPSFAVPKRGYSGDLSELGSVITSCVPVAFLAFMSLWSVAKKYAEKLGHADLDPNQEAFALGMTNIFGGFFSCFPSAASFSRSALNETSGARSPLSNLFVGLMVAVCLVALTPLLYYLPMPCLGGIILVALLGMVDLAPFWLAYRIAKPDFIVMVSAFLFTATISIEVGLVTGIMVSIAALLQELSEVQTSEMVPVAMPGPDSMHKQDLVKVIRLTMNIFFGSMEGLKETFTQVLEQGGSRLRAVVVDAAGVSHADLSGILGLDEMYKHAEDRGIKFVIIHAHGVFRDRLKAAGLFHKLGQQKYQHMPTSEVVRCLIIDLANDPRNGHGGSSGSFGAIPEDFDEEAAGLVSGATSLNGNGTKYGSS